MNFPILCLLRRGVLASLFESAKELFSWLGEKASHGWSLIPLFYSVAREFGTEVENLEQPLDIAATKRAKDALLEKLDAIASRDSGEVASWDARVLLRAVRTRKGSVKPIIVKALKASNPTGWFWTLARLSGSKLDSSFLRSVAGSNAECPFADWLRSKQLRHDEFSSSLVALAERLKHDEIDLRIAAHAGLLVHDMPTVLMKPLFDAAMSESTPRRIRATRLLTEIASELSTDGRSPGVEELLRHLIRLEDAEDVATRSQASVLNGAYCCCVPVTGTALVSRWLRIIDSPAHPKREIALRGVKRMGQAAENTEAFLAAAMNDAGRTAEVRQTCAEALFFIAQHGRKISSATVSSALVRALSNQDDGVRQRAAAALGYSTFPTSRRAIRALKPLVAVDRDPQTKILALQTLGILLSLEATSDQTSTKELLEAVGKPNDTETDGFNALLGMESDPDEGDPATQLIEAAGIAEDEDPDRALRLFPSSGLPLGSPIPLHPNRDSLLRSS